MKTFIRWVACGLLALLCSGPPVSKAQQKAVARDYPVKPVPFTAVHFNDVFWAPRIEINRTVSIPFAFQKSEETGRVTNFVQAAAVLRGTPPPDKKIPPYPFDDTDLYKVIESAAYALTVKPDPKLEAYVDSLIEKIAAAQEPDGYLYPARTIDPANPHRWARCACPPRGVCFTKRAMNGSQSKILMRTA